ncbi:MAG: hypothetical protein LBE86_12955 [Gemmobacter sp.]|jgi:hypothetical protein|nr:hypothetical protein [Gemmobacter sp.]
MAGRLVGVVVVCAALVWLLAGRFGPVQEGSGFGRACAALGVDCGWFARMPEEVR